MNTTTQLLIVEDDRAIARSLRDGLEREGYRVIHAATGVVCAGHRYWYP